MTMKDSFRVEIDMDQSMCSTCKKSSTEYYELKVQVRFNYYEDMLKIKKIVFEKITKRFNSINKFEEIDNGFDFYFRDHGTMNKLAFMFKDYLTIEKRSNKLIGVDRLASKNKYRYFQSIVFVNLIKGDRVSIKGKDYIIRGVNKNELVLMNELKGTKKVVTYAVVKDYLKLLD